MKDHLQVHSKPALDVVLAFVGFVACIAYALFLV
jgi:hypothetical protein